MTNVINFPTTTAKPSEALAAHGGRYNYEVGSKYAATRDLDIAEVAKLVRADIKAAVKAGQLPAGKYGVRISRFSGGQSMDVTIGGLDVCVLNAARVAVEASGEYADWARFPRYSEGGKAILETVEAILAQYNYDRSDSQTDYFDKRFYAHVRFDGAMERAERAEILAGLSA